MLKKNLKSQKGFTLIEIIAVLVILGILAAVAVPKYMDLQKQAANKALDGAVSAGVSTVSMQYARLSLSNSAAPAMAALATASDNNKPESNDFSYAFAPSGDDTGVIVTTSWTDTTKANGGSTSKVRTVTVQ